MCKSFVMSVLGGLVACWLWDRKAAVRRLAGGSLVSVGLVLLVAAVWVVGLGLKVLEGGALNVS